MDEATMVRTYTEAIEALNSGDLVGFGAMLADRCSVMRGNQQIAETREEFVSAISQARERGLIRHDIVSASGHGQVLVSLFHDSFSHGSTVNGGGLLLFNDEGKVIAIRMLAGH